MLTICCDLVGVPCVEHSNCEDLVHRVQSTVQWNITHFDEHWCPVHSSISLMFRVHFLSPVHTSVHISDEYSSKTLG